jgi:N-acetylglucosaminyldiphosphoundecaprenol N-acetyl-beta-D-mannosaminyltransferase
VTANAEMYYAAYYDAQLRQVLNSADLSVPDSVGIMYAIKKQRAAAELYPGIELAQYLLATGLPIYVLGTRQAVLDKLAVPAIVGKHHGYFTAQEEEGIIADIKRCRPKILFVALGVGKQEQFIFCNKQALGVPVMIGVGGAIDVLAGVKKRAPVFFQKVHLEWLYRLWCEPARIFRQYKLMLYWLAVQRCSE